MSIPASASTVEFERGTPRHIAIIMDGNRRWARGRGLPAVEGHRRGILALREVTRAASDLGVEILTVYGFSTENWRREESEVSFLFDLCVFFARTELAELNKNNVRVRIIGDWEALPRRSREALAMLARETASNTGILLNLAVNYSSRAELRDAMRAIAREVASGEIVPEQIDEELVAAHLSTADLPDPDLVIRPGGEQRLSNFLLYQAAYAELVMSEVFWPDFSREDLQAAIAEFRRRARRWGA
ncbi:MAG TPA: polyprenyl diphosphate synthase [Candidatus Dormibacteraeota bacterium]|nr:polyprenyl diphosphate synthase [Candidatus Dormibacteraeota bacterium]